MNRFNGSIQTLAVELKELSHAWTFLAVILAAFFINTVLNAQEIGVGQPSLGVTDLIIKLTGIRRQSGFVYISLWSEREESAFSQAGTAYRSVCLPVRGKQLLARFEKLPVGRYAVALYHDADETGAMSFNFLGLPLEGFGFSRNPKIFFKAPSFSDAAFQLDTTLELEIELTYF